MLSGDPVPTPGEGLLRVFTHSNVGGLTLTNSAANTTDWYGISMTSYEEAYLSAWGAS